MFMKNLKINAQLNNWHFLLIRIVFIFIGNSFYFFVLFIGVQFLLVFILKYICLSIQCTHIHTHKCGFTFQQIDWFAGVFFSSCLIYTLIQITKQQQQQHQPLNGGSVMCVSNRFYNRCDAKSKTLFNSETIKMFTLTSAVIKSK